MRTAALYLRKSTTQHQKNSLQVQLGNMQDYCTGSFDVVRTFEDQQSGRTLQREGLKAAFEWLAQDSDRVLVFYKVDRYARTIDEFGTIRKFIENNQIRFMDIGPAGQSQDMLMIQMKLTFAEQESRMIGARIKSTIKHLKASGRSWGASAETMMELRTVSASVRTQNANDFARELLEVVEIVDPNRELHQAELAHRLNRVGFRTRRGANWSQQSLSRVLKRTA